MFKGASILSGPAVMGFPAQDTACLLLPDGTLQPLAQGLLPLPRPSLQAPPEVVKRQRNTSETVVSVGAQVRVNSCDLVICFENILLKKLW